jgi:CDP-4-dehydro-6-deoxyglucose reductase
MVCTGTGIAPFKSMIDDLLYTNATPKAVHLVFGCRTQQDLLYYKELKEYCKKAPWLNFIPTLSREAWEGALSGYVHAHYAPLAQATLMGKNTDVPYTHAHFYLCGWKNMVDDAKKNILELGFDKKQIHLELYG